ncbi:hypothetical protein [Aquitalea magnusonii]|uniref:hypothetical protein n=1 Tax=Aquitalea magnusonii TaxID=332411 RepID=UPI0011AE7A75|nr:hypothetical protein [Aquitalea magnusonii]
MCAFPNICVQPARLKEVVAGVDFIISIEDLESPDKLVFIAQTEAGPIIIVMDDDGVEIRVHSEKTLLLGEEIVRMLEERGAGAGLKLSAV